MSILVIRPTFSMRRNLRAYASMEDDRVSGKKEYPARERGGWWWEAGTRTSSLRLCLGRGEIDLEFARVEGQMAAKYGQERV